MFSGSQQLDGQKYGAWGQNKVEMWKSKVMLNCCWLFPEPPRSRFMSQNYLTKLEWWWWPLQDSCLPLRHSGAHDCLASPIKIFFYYQGRRDSEQPTSKTFHTSATPQGAITHGKVLQKTIKEWQLGSKQSENRTISRQAKNRQDRFCIWQKTT